MVRDLTHDAAAPRIVRRFTHRVEPGAAWPTVAGRGPPSSSRQFRVVSARRRRPDNTSRSLGVVRPLATLTTRNQRLGRLDEPRARLTTRDQRLEQPRSHRQAESKTAKLPGSRQPPESGGSPTVFGGQCSGLTSDEPGTADPRSGRRHPRCESPSHRRSDHRPGRAAAATGAGSPVALLSLVGSPWVRRPTRGLSSSTGPRRLVPRGASLCAQPPAANPGPGRRCR
jgi:hypothetical protein